MSDDKKPESDSEAPGDAAAPEAETKKPSETQEKLSAAAKAAGDKTAAAAKAAGEKTAAAAKVAGEKTAAAASRAREEASKSYDEARSSISDADDRTIAIVSYALYLAMFVTGGVAAIVGVILAYLKKDSGDAVLDSHYDYMIRSFWLGLAGAFVAILLIATLIGAIIGIPLLLAITIWWLLRNVIGLIRLLDNKPIPDPKTWLV